MATTNKKTLLGGCLCGDVRFELTGPPVDAGFCHCKICQKANAAPTVAWVTAPIDAFSYTGKPASVYASTAEYQREFCPRCGTQIAFRARHNAKTIDVTLCSLDDSSSVEPQYHIWCESKLPWIEIGDQLPRFTDAGPDEEFM